MNYNNTYHNPIWVYTKSREYFDIEELVRKDALNYLYNKYGAKHGEDMAWAMFDFRLLSNLLFMRINLNLVFTANDYIWNGRFDERGYRDNQCDMLKGKNSKNRIYVTPHFGDAIDFTVKTMFAEDVRMWAKEHENEFPFHARFEHRKSDGTVISWVHMDCWYLPGNSKVNLFNI